MEKRKPIEIKCPSCGKRTEWVGNPDKPFCSDRCRLADLGRWSAESYRIPCVENSMSSDNPDEGEI